MEFVVGSARRRMRWIEKTRVSVFYKDPSACEGSFSFRFSFNFS